MTWLRNVIESTPYWHSRRLGHRGRWDEMTYPGVSTRVYFCECGMSWGAPAGYRDGESRGPHGY